MTRRTLDKTRLPNLFDQYTQPENRVTNSLLQTLAASPRLTRQFLAEFVPGVEIAGEASLLISSQRTPEIERKEVAEKSEKNPTIPDGWIVSRLSDEETETVVVVETKIVEKSSKTELRNQLTGHLEKGALFEPRRLHALLITPDHEDPLPGWKAPVGKYCWRSWRDVYRFARGQRGEFQRGSATRLLLENLKEYLEMNDIVGFTGIDFSDGYEELKARKILKNLMNEIRPEVLKVYPHLSKRKGNIKDPWDVFAPDDVDQFTKANHLVVSIDPRCLAVLLTVPNNNAWGWRRLKQVVADPDRQDQLMGILARTREMLPNLRVKLAQRHFVAQRFAYDDASIEVDLDTTDFARAPDLDTRVKPNPTMFDLLLAALRTTPANVNREVNFIAEYHYRDYPLTAEEGFRDEVLFALVTFQELLEFLAPR